MDAFTGLHRAKVGGPVWLLCVCVYVFVLDSVSTSAEGLAADQLTGSARRYYVLSPFIQHLQHTQELRKTPLFLSQASFVRQLPGLLLLLAAPVGGALLMGLHLAA